MQIVPPRTQVPFKEDDVEKNRRRIMYYSRPPEPQQPSRNWPRTPARPATGTSVALSSHPPSGALPCHETPHARPRGSDGQHEARGREGSPEAGLHPDAHPAPELHAGAANIGGGRVGVRGHGSAGGGGNPGATDVYVAGRADVRMDLRHGYCVSGDRGSIRRRCFSTSCTLERTYVQVNLANGTGYTS